MPKYVTPRAAQKLIGVASSTIKQWAQSGYIDFITTPGGKRLYDVNKFINNRSANGNQDIGAKQKICYCRVSSIGQKDDLERQVQAMRTQFPSHKIITDIGSGINFKRKGLLQLLELSNKQLVSEVVIAFRDRLCRFAFELIEWQLSQNQVKLVVLNQGMDTPNQELADDLMSIVHVFNCRMQGKRKYTKKSSQQEVKQITK